VPPKTEQLDSLQISESKVSPLTGEFARQTAPANQQHLKDQGLKAYSQQNQKANQDKLIVEYLPLVYRIVQNIISYLQTPLSRDDLISAGTIGLVKAARDFDTSKDVEFKTYAYIRVRGAVIDELREWSFAPTSLKKKFVLAQRKMQEMTEQLGQAPTDEQLAEELGMTTEKMYQMFENARARHFLSIHGVDENTPALGESLTATDDSSEPVRKLERLELRKHLGEAIAELPQRQRRIILLYYHKELTMKEIALTLDITESRVSQLHASALFKLAGKLRQWDDTRQ
jgi:RNA polymerase sigma factor for flagellar operon FliA